MKVATINPTHYSLSIELTPAEFRALSIEKAFLDDMLTANNRSTAPLFTDLFNQIESEVKGI